MGSNKVIGGNTITDSDPLQVQITAGRGGALTDRSGTIDTGGTAQNAAAANTSRKYLYLENPAYKADGTTANTAERLCFRTDATATLGAGSICLDPGQSFEYAGAFVPTGAVSVVASTTGHAWTCKEG